MSFFKKTFAYLLIFSFSLIGILFIYKKNQEPKEVFYAFTEMSEILKYNKVIFETANKKLMVDTIIDFTNQKTIEEVQYKLNNFSYSISELGLPDSTYCNISVNLNNDAIYCELKNKLKASGTLIFTKTNINEWSCFYDGDSFSKPVSCSSNIEILAKS